METKKCFKCGRVLPISEFYKHPQMADGHLNKCKDCTKSDTHNNYVDNRKKEDYVEKERARGRDKYWRLYSPKKNNPRIGHSAATSFSGTRNTRKFYKRRGIDIGDWEFHHWNYNKRNDVFAIPHRGHVLAHRFLTFDNESGLFYYEGKLLKTKAEHRAFLEKVFENTGYKIKEYNL